jgi:hypothetical protein
VNIFDDPATGSEIILQVTAEQFPRLWRPQRLTHDCGLFTASTFDPFLRVYVHHVISSTTFAILSAHSWDSV